MDSAGSTKSGSHHYRVYHWRWLLLVTLCVLNVSSGMIWLTFAPVPDLTASFYHISLDDVDWFSNSCFAATLTIGFFSILVLATFGLGVAVFTGAVLNLVGAILRYISTIQPIICSTQYPQAGFGVAILGQVLTACAQPFFLYAPTKLANTWFKHDERSVCTGIASIANTLGRAVSQLVAPHVVTTTTDLPTLLWIYIIPAGVGSLLSLSYIRSKPPVPPAPSGDIQAVPFLKGLKQTVTNLNFLVLLAVWGLAAGGFNAFLIIVPQYLCPYGYSNQDVGLWAFLLIILGLVGATVSGIITDKTKLFKEIGVGGYSVAMLWIICFVNVAGYTDQSVIIAISLSMFGFFGLALLPVFLELGVEVTYPVGEATSSGLLWSVAQVTSMVMLLVTSNLLTTEVPPDLSEYNRCGAGLITTNNTVCPGENLSHGSGASPSTSLQDWTYAGIFILVIGFVGYLLFVLAFRADLKRVKMEQKKGDKERRNS